MAARACMLALLGLIAALLVPSTAAAKPDCAGQTTAPAGNSEVDQYSEFVPGACGDENPGDRSGAGPADAIPPSTVADLESAGADGEAAAALARNLAPRGTGSGGSAGGSAGAGQSPLGGLVDAVAGSKDGGMGILLPIILVVTGAAAVLYAAQRRRAGQVD